MKRLLLMLLCCLPLLIQAETIIVGTVIDQLTGQPIQNANVYYKNTNIGCATNEEGLFMVRCDLQKKSTLIVSALGYKNRKFTIEPEQYAGLQVELEEQTMILGDVIATPNDNPAKQLILQVRANRLKNDVTLNPAITFNINEQKDLYISQIEQKHLKRAIWRNLQKGMITQDDSTYLLPLYTSDAVYHKQASTTTLLQPRREKSIILTPTNYQVLLSSTDDYLNFYRNTLSIQGKTFLSPLASSAAAHYKYILADSTRTDNEKHYIVNFYTKNQFEPTFSGEMEIDSATFALRRVHATVAKNVSVNYLRSMEINQTFNTDNTLLEDDYSAIFDFAVKIDESHVFPTALLHKHSTAQRMSADTSVKQELQEPSLTDSALNRLDSLPLVRTAKFIAHIINTGNIPTGSFLEIGNVEEIVNYTPHEGWHLGLPLTTNEKLLKRVEFSAYFGYGFRDKLFKGKGQIRILLPTRRRQMLGAYYWDHYSYSDVSEMDKLKRENSIFYREQDFTHWLLNGVQYDKRMNTAVRQQEYKLWIENDITDILETRFAISHTTWSRLQDIGANPATQLKTYRLQALFRLGFHERRVDMFLNRFHIHSNYPTLFLHLEAGSFSTTPAANTKSDYDLYAKLQLMVSQTVLLGLAGQMNYTVEGGLIFGNVPYPLLEQFTSNQSYTYDRYRFTLMLPCQYVASKYLSAHLNWNGEGVLFNRIPYINYLHLRELAEVKIAWGNRLSEYPNNSSNIPYIEAGIGIGNILRVGEVYAVFRLTNLNDRQAPWWAIRFRLSLGM